MINPFAFAAQFRPVLSPAMRAVALAWVLVVIVALVAAHLPI